MVSVLTLESPPFVRTGHISKQCGNTFFEAHVQKPKRNELAASSRRNESAVSSKRNDSASRQPHRSPALLDPGQTARNIHPTVPSRTPEAIAEATAEEARRLEEGMGALGEESPDAEPLKTDRERARRG